MTVPPDFLRRAEPLADGALQTLRRRYSDEAFRSIPHLLQLVDRNPYSRTYGCFDRAYWHYRTMDFPCGMAQEFCLPLAMVHALPYPDNPWLGRERVRELALAGVDFARRSAHRDGSCDDYFPFERALGAMVFSLYACTESCLVLDDRRAENLEFFARRGEWLLRHNESGRLANHQAFAALALHNVGKLTGDNRFLEGRDAYLEIVRSWQHEEGWFQEYEGADPGYQSCTISFLSRLMRKTEGSPTADSILAMLRPAVSFAWHFMHPDGSYAGEYGSRNTYHFYPHGFEVMAAHEPKAGQVADQFLRRALPEGRRYFNDDDRMCAHYVYDWLQAYLEFHPVRPEPINERPDFDRHFADAGLLVAKRPAYYAVLSLAKGGVLKVTGETGPIAGDTGFIARTIDGDVLVSHIITGARGSVTGGEGPLRAEVEGVLCRRRVNLPTPARQVLFRILNLTFGRFAPDLLRRILQKVLITGKPVTPHSFRRVFTFHPDRIETENEIRKTSDAAGFTSLHIGSDATSIYVANSNVYQESVLLPWRDYSHLVETLNREGRITWRSDVAIPPAAEDSPPRSD